MRHRRWLIMICSIKCGWIRVHVHEHPAGAGREVPERDGRVGVRDARGQTGQGENGSGSAVGTYLASSAMSNLALCNPKR